MKEIGELIDGYPAGAADVEKIAGEICTLVAIKKVESKPLFASDVAAVLRRSLQPPLPQNGWIRVEDGLPDDDSDVYAAIPWTHTPSAERKYIIHDCSYYEGGKLPDGSQQKIFTDCEGEEFEAHEVGYWIYKYRLAEQLPPLAATAPQETQ
jgi:hypothetical protein